MNKKLSDWLSRNELRFWMYACPFISFGVANSYTFADAFFDRAYSDFIDFYLLFVNLLLPMILPLKNQDNLKFIAIALAVQSPILAHFRDMAEFGHSIGSGIALFAVPFQLAIICFPIAARAMLQTVKEGIATKKSPSSKPAEGFSDSDSLS